MIKIKQINIDEFLTFYTEVSHASNSYKLGKNLYKKFRMKYDSIEKYQDDIKEGTRLDPVYLYTSIRLELKCDISVFNCKISNAYHIAKFFNMIDEDFIRVCNEKYEKWKTNRYRINEICSLLIKMCIVTQKSNIREFSLNDIRDFEKELVQRYKNIDYHYRTRISLIERIVTGRIKPYNVRRFIRDNEYKYGTEEIGFINVIERYYSYLDQKPYKDKKTRQQYKSATKRFFKWLKEEFPDINELNNIKRIHWEKYKKTLINMQTLASDTREGYINSVSIFFEWCYTKGFIMKEVVELGERVWLRDHHISESNKRMYQNREHYIKVFTTILTYEPNDEFELLARHFLLIASACGLRRKELYWLGPDCISFTEDGVGDITSQIQEKSGIINKPTSIMPWGIDSVNFLQERFNSRDKILFYDDESGKEYYSLFEYEGKILYRTSVYSFFDKIMILSDIRDINGQIVLYKNIKLHAFRHQKFNDIYEVTKGNLSAVQCDSDHKSMLMLRNYVVQDIRKKKQDAVRIIEEGKIVGRAAEILNAMLETPYAPDQLLDIVKKMNVSATFVKENIKETIKDLGFGFCSSDSCKLRRVCEGCIYFFTCSRYLKQLQSRYINNFYILQYKIMNEDKYKIIEEESFQDFIIDLKYQEKWLIQLGMSEQEIHNLVSQMNEN
ncbi:hypothetical protein [Clostridium saccharoperbutylacetonicum]|uniref:hypothetical protein n=1 Tax=Clostridium saccharoperbutylacetonicum TaxID=36745 RepID=UPI0039ECCB76